MIQFQLQLLGSRLVAQAKSYDRSIDWIDHRIMDLGENVLRLIDDLLQKDCYKSIRTMVFYDFEFSRECVIFHKPVHCCGKLLKNTETLTVHLLNNKKHEDVDGDKTRLAMEFFILLQAASNALQRYNEDYERIDNTTADCFRKGHVLVERILKKTRKETTFLNVLFDVDVWKWKVVFDYTCGPCEKMGVKCCRFVDAIAWFKVFKDSISVNPILHLESKLHFESIHYLPKDKLLIREINNNRPLTPAGIYLMNVTEYELNDMCKVGKQIERDSSFDRITKYVREKLSHKLGEMNIIYFGSRIMGTANRDSDYDIFIESCSNKEPTECFNISVKWALTHPEEVIIVRMIPEGPLLLSIYVEDLGAALDLTFKDTYATANCQLKKYFFDLQPLARKLYFLLRMWQREIGITQFFHDHLMAMLVIFFMQRKKYLPSVRSLLIGPPMRGDEYNTRFEKDIPKPPQPRDLFSLTKDFFRYWAEFDWTRNGVSVFEAAVLPREKFRFDPQRSSPMMCSDFFNQRRNCAARLATSGYRMFVEACQEANEVLKQKKKM
ncbi:uncharacterized protein LOC129776119 [Toxorhynchites rutilus septentrionalis]|uniref:uncharacterized protein LOC129776119 n=1 Tax=Toxorhynchites rutilus septentrionalis TaxID=329112 RepID=UPI00247A2C93|nr:uncharacterized protein LOC129776119 [Toxorhynchites rutilus septentrionalis]